MTLRANNNDVLAALAATINCRDSRRGRKPSWNILISTNDKGTVHIYDLSCGGCSRVVGKRSYSRKHKHSDGSKMATSTVKAIKKGQKDSLEGRVQIVGDSTVRISQITGKPVRSYKKRTEFVDRLIEHTDKVEKSYIEDVTDCLANLRIDVEKAELAKEAANLTGNHKTVKMLDTIITGLGAKVKEMEAKLAAVQ